MATYEVLEEISRWRLAYDTVSALVERTGREQRHLLETVATESDDFSLTGMVSDQLAAGQVVGHVTTPQPIGRVCCSSVGEVVSSDRRGLDGSRQGAPQSMNHSVLGLLLPESQRATTPSHHDPRILSSTMTSSPISLPLSSNRMHSHVMLAEHNSLASDVMLLTGTFNGVSSAAAGERTDVSDDVINPQPGTDPRASVTHRSSHGRRSTTIDSGTTWTMSNPGFPVADGLRHPGTFPFESGALIELFRHLMDAFYTETFLWMYLNAIGRPSSRRLRHRLHMLSVATCRSLDQATINILSGYLAGYRRSRAALSENVEAALLQLSNADRGDHLYVDSDGQVDQTAWLGRLAVELGVALNPRQMLRSFSAVVRDLLSRTASMRMGVGHGQGHHESSFTIAHGRPEDWYIATHSPAAELRSDQDQPLHRQNSFVSSLPAHDLDVPASSSLAHHNYHHHIQLQHHRQQTFGDVIHAVPALSSSSLSRHHHVGHDTTEQSRHQSDGRRAPDDVVTPPPPPPYPSFLLHFLTMLATPFPPSVHSMRNQETASLSDYSYEAMLALGERLGEVKNRGMSPNAIELLPVYVYDPQTSSSICDSCVICLETFQTKERLRVLPCQHKYHVECVDRWLEINSTCPVCRFEINDISSSRV